MVKKLQWTGDKPCQFQNDIKQHQQMLNLSSQNLEHQTNNDIVAVTSVKDTKYFANNRLEVADA